MNTSDETELIGEKLNAVARVVFIVIACLEIFSGVVGNMFLLTVMYTRHLLNARKLYSFLIANLAVSDMLCVGYWMVFLAADLILDYHPVMNKNHCIFNGFFIGVVYMTGTLTILSISLNHYLHICHANLYARFATMPRAIMWCVCLWVLGICAALPAHYGYNPVVHSCSFKQSDKYGLTMVILFSSVPLCFVGYWNHVILRHLRHATMSIRSSDSSVLHPWTSGVGLQQHRDSDDCSWTPSRALTEASEVDKCCLCCGQRTERSDLSHALERTPEPTEIQDQTENAFGEASKTHVELKGQTQDGASTSTQDRERKESKCSVRRESQVHDGASVSAKGIQRQQSDPSVRYEIRRQGPTSSNAGANQGQESKYSIRQEKQRQMAASSNAGGIPKHKSKCSKLQLSQTQVASSSNAGTNQRQESKYSVQQLSQSQATSSSYSTLALSQSQAASSSYSTQLSSQLQVTSMSNVADSQRQESPYSMQQWSQSQVTTSSIVGDSQRQESEYSIQQMSQSKLAASSNAGDIPTQESKFSIKEGSRTRLSLAKGRSQTENEPGVAGHELEKKRTLRVSIAGDLPSPGVHHRPSDDHDRSTTSSVSYHLQILHEIQERRRKKDEAVVRALHTIFLLLVFTFMPFGTTMFLGVLVPQMPNEVRVFGDLVLFASNAVNWLVYGVINPTYRKAYALTLRRLCRAVCGRLYASRNQVD